MKTVKDYILEMIEDKNIDNEYIEKYELLVTGIEQYIQDRNIENNLERYKDKEVLYSKMVKNKLLNFQTYHFHMLVFYFVNYSIISKLFMIKGQAEIMSLECEQNNAPIDQKKARDIYHKALKLAGQCQLLEYEDHMIEQLLYSIKLILKISEL